MTTKMTIKWQYRKGFCWISGRLFHLVLSDKSTPPRATVMRDAGYAPGTHFSEHFISRLALPSSGLPHLDGISTARALGARAAHPTCMWHPQPAHTWWFWLPACPSYFEYPKSGERLIRASQRLPRSVLNLRSIPLPFGSSNSKESVSGLEIKPISHALGDVTFQKGFALLDNTQHLYRRFFLVSQDLSEVCGMFSLLLRQNTMGSAGSMLCLSQHRTRHLLRAAPAQWTLQNSTGSFISSVTGIFIWAELTVVSRQALRKTSPLSFTCSVWASPAGSERKERGGSSSWGSAFPWGPGFPLVPLLSLYSFPLLSTIPCSFPCCWADALIRKPENMWKWAAAPWGTLHRQQHPCPPDILQQQHPWLTSKHSNLHTLQGQGVLQQPNSQQNIFSMDGLISCQCLSSSPSEASSNPCLEWPGWWRLWNNPETSLSELLLSSHQNIPLGTTGVLIKVLCSRRLII